MKRYNNQVKFNVFSFVSTFARSLIEIFISLYLYKNGFSIRQVVLFYFFINIFAIPLSYLFVKLGEKLNYIYVMFIGIISFFIVQVLLQEVYLTFGYLILIAFIYSIYRRGYWVARRFYITEIMPNKESSGLYSIIIVSAQIASILASIVGSYLLDFLNIITLNILSLVLIFISIIPLTTIKYEHKQEKIELFKNLKKYNKNNLLIFSIYELNNLLSFIFPIYIAIYFTNSYSMIGSLNVLSNIAIILFIFIYGKIINRERNYFVLSTFLVIICCILKLNVSNYLILIIYFLDGIVCKMQNQSVNKIYFENRGNISITNYNLIYQIVECSCRALVALLLVFVSDIKIMIMMVICVIILLLIIYFINNLKNK